MVLIDGRNGIGNPTKAEDRAIFITLFLLVVNFSFTWVIYQDRRSFCERKFQVIGWTPFWKSCIIDEEFLSFFLQVLHKRNNWASLFNLSSMDSNFNLSRITWSSNRTSLAIMFHRRFLFRWFLALSVFSLSSSPKSKAESPSNWNSLYVHTPRPRQA